MDPLTHVLTGIGMATLTGTPASLGNPLYTAAALGSLAPDLDFFYRFRGELSYLHQHRGMTHSMLGIIGTAPLLSYITHFFYPEAQFSYLLLWSFLGAVSHVLLDFFNPHGVQLIWPFSRKRYHWSLLNGFDPIFNLISLVVIVSSNLHFSYASLILICYLFYLMLRWSMSKIAFTLVKKNLCEKNTKKIITMPSLLSLWSWDFLADDGNTVTAGEVKCFSRSLSIFRILNKHENSIINKALNNNIGKLFCDFTPYMHISLTKCENKKTILEFIDLRYRIHKTFLHSAVAVFNEDEELEQASFYPFSKNRKISLVG